MLKDLHITDCTEVQKIVELVLEIQRKSHSERIKNGIKLKKNLVKIELEEKSMKRIKKNDLRILKLISLNRRTVLGETYCSLSQLEMANVLGIAYATVNSGIKRLIDSELVEPREQKVRKYKLTEQGKNLVKKFRKK